MSRQKILTHIIVLTLITVVATHSLEIRQETANPDKQLFANNDSPYDLTLVLINKLFNLQQLPLSQQLSACLSNSSQSSKLSQIIQEWAVNGSQQSSSTLSKTLYSVMVKINSSIALEVRNCIEGSNDFKILLHRYNVTNINYFYSQFQNFSKIRFLDLHYWFTNMSSIFSNQKFNDTQKYEKVAQIINQLTLNVYNKYGIKADDPWKLRVEQVQKLTEYYGISVSNGVLGVVSSQRPLKLHSSVLAGAYDKIGRGRVDNLVQTFPALNMELYYNGNSGYYNYVQELNMREGSMTHSLSSSQLSLSYTYYALQNLPNVLYTQFTITAHEDGQLTVKNIHQAPQTLSDLHKNQQDIDTAVKVFNIISSEAKTKTGKLTLVSASSFQFDGKISPTILHEDWDSGVHLQKFNKALKKGDVFKFSVITCLLSSQNHQDPGNQAIRMVIRASSMTNIIAGHLKIWNSLWESDIIIEGNDSDQKYIRSMLYHCYSFISSYKSYGLSPMGLSGLGYNGHVFWDMDLWIYPAILILKPSLAKSLINYRYERLQAAKQNAFLNGYKGAMFPWESSKSGDEETPVWALSGPLQHHISGCVSFGAWNYYQVTQDKQWLAEKGYPIIRQVATFFQSRVQYGEDGFYHIKNVVGADEWAQNVDDNAFTNGIAKISLLIANKAAKILGLATNSKWDEISNKIIILKMSNGVTREHSTYNGENIKQADVNLLAFPLNIVNKTQDIIRDLEYYKVRVPDRGTPAMTYSIFTLLYSKLKNSTQAYKNFKQSFLPFIKGPFGVFAQTKGGSNPYFLTGAGGVLQSVIFGFAGFNIGDQGIYMTNNSIPTEWKKVTIKTQTKIFDINQPAFSSKEQIKEY